MSLSSNLPALFAQVEPNTQTQIVTTLAITAAVLILPFVVGAILAKWLRMHDYGWKIGLILCALTAATVVVARGNLHFGVDLRGGSILIYELEPDQPSFVGEVPDGAMFDPRAVMDPDRQRDPDAPIDRAIRVDQALVQAISERINPAGTKEIVVRPYGDRQIEIIIPETDPLEVERIKRLIGTAGALEFRILATQRAKHRELISQAQELAADPVRRLERTVLSEDGEVLGNWVRVARDEQAIRGVRPFKVDVSGDIVRDARTGELLDIPPGVELATYVRQQGIEEIDVLVARDEWNVTGDYLGSVQAGFDDTLNPNVRFSMRGVGAKLFQELTREYSPDRETGEVWKLGIVLDNRLLSAPVIRSIISDRGEISGQFSQEEVNFLVGILQAGRLPATLQKEPITENQIGSMLGIETIRKGSVAIGVSLIAVLIFILVYYRFAGIVASFALLANLLFIMALMILMRASLTLPGLAGLVLTVGMSVDANVLIFERIREELNRGAALRMAIRNGFGRAMSTIIDANLTTLITGIVLYAIGTDQIRGFAVTLILGILMSMFTAIFCSRVIFDVAERKRWLTRLSMMQLVGKTHIDFVKKQKVAAVVSVVLIIVGLIGVADRRQNIFDIDFLGGVSVTMTLAEPLEDREVRQRLSETLGQMTDERGSRIQYTLNRVFVQGMPPNTFWKIDASFDDVAPLQAVLTETFPLARYQVNVASVEQVAATATSQPSPTSSPAVTPPPGASSDAGWRSIRSDLPSETLVALADELDADVASDAADPAATDESRADPAAGQSPQADEAPPAAQEPVTETPAETPGAEPAGADEAAPSPAADPESPIDQVPAAAPTPPVEADPDAPPTRPEPVRSTATLSFPGHPISAATLQDELRRAATQANVAIGDFAVAATDPQWVPESAQAFDEWTVTAVSAPEQLQQVLNALQQDLEGRPVWLSSSKIGGKVATDTQLIAIFALLASLVGIVAYVWFRFQRLSYGLAAVVALLHDVMITLGAIAVSAYVAGIFGFLLIEEFKISLPVVAAFLTLIGYSLNDTIVVFDRIREVKGKSPQLTGEMINTSLNLTLGRTLLTSLTTLLVVLILYFVGGEGIHGFAFALVVGVIVGTYSSMFVASPVLLWLASRSQPAVTSKAA